MAIYFLNTVLHHRIEPIYSSIYERNTNIAYGNDENDTKAYKKQHRHSRKSKENTLKRRHRQQTRLLHFMYLNYDRHILDAV